MPKSKQNGSRISVVWTLYNNDVNFGRYFAHFTLCGLVDRMPDSHNLQFCVPILSYDCMLFFWDRWSSLRGKLSWDVTTTQVNSALHPLGVAKLSTSFDWGKGRTYCSRWQVTLCDPIWHVIFRISVVIFDYELLHPLCLLTYRYFSWEFHCTAYVYYGYVLVICCFAVFCCDSDAEKARNEEDG